MATERGGGEDERKGERARRQHGTKGGLRCKKQRAMEGEKSTEIEKESRIPAYRWPRRDEVCTWCRLTCLFSWRTRPRCRKVSGQREQRASRSALSPVPSGSSFSTAIASSSSTATTTTTTTLTFLIRLCLPLARWREEILEMRDSFIKGEKRCQRGRHHRVGRFDHTNYRDSSDATRSSLSVSLSLSPFLSFFLPSPIPGSLSRVRMTSSRERSAREKYMPSDRANSLCVGLRLYNPRRCILLGLYFLSGWLKSI